MKCLLLSNRITEFSKKDIDQGFCPKQIYQICCSLRTCFCLSYAIRKKNDLFTYFIENNTAVKFIGRELRFLGPDERSQALLLYKALKKRKSKSIITAWTESTPGIYIKEYEDFPSFLREFLRLEGSQNYLVLTNENESLLNNLGELEQSRDMHNKGGTYIFPLDNIQIPKPLMNRTFLKDNAIKVVSFENLRKIQDEILIINYWIDSNQSKKEKLE